MFQRWEDLTSFEKEVAESTMAGVSHDGGWDFRKRPRRIVRESTLTPIKLLVQKYGRQASKPEGKQPTAGTVAEAGSAKMERAASQDDLPVQARNAFDPQSTWGDPHRIEVSAVSADFLQRLITGRVRDANGDPIRCLRGISLKRVRVDGTVNLTDLRDANGGSLPSLRLEACLLLERASGSDASIDISRSSILSLSLAGSLVDGIAAVSARIDGDCDLSNVTLLRVSNVNLRSAKIAHSLYLSGMRAIEDRTTSSGANEFEIDLRSARVEASIVADALADRPAYARAGTNGLLKARVQAENLVVEGDLDLFRATVSELHLWKARIKGNVRLQRLFGDSVNCMDMHCGQLDLGAAALGPVGDEAASSGVAFDLSGAEVASDVYADVYADLSDSLQANGSVSFHGARIGGSLRLFAAQIRSANKGGAIWASGAKITGTLDMSGAQVTAEEDTYAISADSIVVVGSVDIGAGIHDDNIVPSNFVGSVSFIRAKVGTFGCQGTVITASEVALDLCSSDIPGGVYARCQALTIGKTMPGLKAKGTVRFVAARVNHLDFEGASLTAPSGHKRGAVALDIAESVIQGKVRLNKSLGIPFEANGLVRLRRTIVESDLILRGGRFNAAPDKVDNGAEVVDAGHRYRAIECEGLVLKGHVLLGGRPLEGDAGNGDTICNGAVVFDRADINGDVVIGTAHLAHHPNAGEKPCYDERALALSFKNAVITGDVVVQRPFGANKRARIGIVDFSGSALRAFDDEDGLGWGVAPSSQNGLIHDGLQLRLDGCVFQAFAMSQPPQARYSVGQAFLSIVAWLLTPLRLVLRALGLMRPQRSTLAMKRLEWLNRQFTDGRPKTGDFFPHAFVQTARVLTASGRSADARRIIVGQRKTALKAHAESGFDRFWSRIYGWTFSFGHSPLHASVSFAVVLLIGSLMTAHLLSTGWLVAQPDPVAVAGEQSAPQPCQQNPVLYALDQMLVIVDLNAHSDCLLLDKPAFSGATPSVPPSSGPADLWTGAGEFVSRNITASNIELFFGIYGIVGTLTFFLTALAFSGVLRRDKND